MRTYRALPKKYRNLDWRKMTIMGDYAYTIRYARYTGERDYVYRISIADYNKLREDAIHWPIYLADPTEDTLQSQISSYVSMPENECLYCQTEKVW